MLSEQEYNEMRAFTQALGYWRGFATEEGRLALLDEALPLEERLKCRASINWQDTPGSIASKVYIYLRLGPRAHTDFFARYVGAFRKKLTDSEEDTYIKSIMDPALANYL